MGMESAQIRVNSSYAYCNTWSNMECFISTYTTALSILIAPCHVNIFGGMHSIYVQDRGQRLRIDSRVGGGGSPRCEGSGSTQPRNKPGLGGRRISLPLRTKQLLKFLVLGDRTTDANRKRPHPPCSAQVQRSNGS